MITWVIKNTCKNFFSLKCSVATVLTALLAGCLLRRSLCSSLSTCSHFSFSFSLSASSRMTCFVPGGFSSAAVTCTHQHSTVKADNLENPPRKWTTWKTHCESRQLGKPTAKVDNLENPCGGGYVSKLTVYHNKSTAGWWAFALASSWIVTSHALPVMFLNVPFFSSLF